MHRELFEHSFPDFLIFQAFIEGDDARVDGIEDAAHYALQHDDCLVIEVLRLLHICAEHLITERLKIIDIDVVLIDLELIIAHIAQFFAVEQRFQCVLV